MGKRDGGYVLFFLIVLGLLGVEIFGNWPAMRTQLAAGWSELQARVSHRYAFVALAGLVGSLALELLLARNLNAQPHIPFGPWLQALPLSVTVRFPHDFVPLRYHEEMLALGAVQALLLGIYLMAMHGRPWRRIDTVAAAGSAVAMVVLALCSRAITSDDMYAYVADSLLGARAYDPPLTRLPGEFAIIHHLWKFPLLPAAYGPAWLGLNAALLGLVQGLNAKLALLRLENVVALGVIIGALRALRVAPRYIAAAAVNPAIAFYYLCDGHNDIVVIAVILLTMTFAGRAPILAGILAGVGASMKLTFVLPAAAVALVIATLPKRIAYFAAMSGIATAIALLFGGQPYVHALSVVSHEYAPANADGWILVPHVVLVLVMVVLTVVAVTTRRTYLGATFGFAGLAQALFPWYTIWGLPYAIARGQTLAMFLIGLPVVAAVLDVGSAPKLAAFGACAALLVACASALRGVRLPRRAGSPGLSAAPRR